jgi:hypothetical protein
MLETGYQCRDCGAVAAVVSEDDRTVVVRSCSCPCPIVAVMETVIAGKGGVTA